MRTQKKRKKNAAGARYCCFSCADGQTQASMVTQSALAGIRLTFRRGGAEAEARFTAGLVDGVHCDAKLKLWECKSAGTRWRTGGFKAWNAHSIHLNLCMEAQSPKQMRVDESRGASTRQGGGRSINYGTAGSSSAVHGFLRLPWPVDIARCWQWRLFFHIVGARQPRAAAGI